MTTNPPLPNYDMMTGQLVTKVPARSANAADVLVNHADVVHVQLLDRMILVPRAIVNGPLLRNKITSPNGQGPVDQQGEAYLLFVDWKNFNPLLEYMCGNPVQLPSGKSDLLQLRNTARKFDAREFERLVTRHLRRLHGGGCSPFACMHKPKKQVAANSQPTPNPAKLMQVLQQQEEQQQQQQQQQQLQQAPAPDVQKPMQMTHGTSVFSRARATKSHKANQGFDTRQNQLYVAAHTRQPAEQIYDLQRPLIV
ncbi:hypothetical protein ABBQ38_012304 [Trebouxia sp. C0009 RCD-2024]